MRFTDKVSVSTTRRTSDGYLVADVKVARTGIQYYAGHEMGRPDLGIVSVYRPESEVFSKDSMSSFAHKPVTDNHPDESVGATNWKDLAVGSIGEDVARDGDFIRVPLVVMDAASIKKVEDGKRELSAGYSCEIVWGDGVAPDGSKYQATQKDIRVNHVAIVTSARAGSEARIGDDAGKWGVSPVHTKPADGKESLMADALRKVLVDGLQVETTDAGATAIEKLMKDLSSSAARIETLTADHAKALADKDATIAKKDAEIDTLKGKVLDGSALDAAVQARGDLIATAKAIVSDIETQGLSDAAIRKAVVTKKLGDSVVKDKSDAYIDARFDILAEDAKGTEQVRQAINGIVPSNVGDAQGNMNKAFSDSVSDLNAWRDRKEA